MFHVRSGIRPPSPRPTEPARKPTQPLAAVDGDSIANRQRTASRIRGAKVGRNLGSQIHGDILAGIVERDRLIQAMMGQVVSIEYQISRPPPIHGH